MTESENSRGAQWRKWDLHVHTPASIKQLYGSGEEAWERFLTELEALPSEFAVVSLDDLLALRTKAVDVEIKDIRGQLSDRAIDYVKLSTRHIELNLTELEGRKEEVETMVSIAKTVVEESRARLSALEAGSRSNPDLEVKRVRLSELDNRLR